MQSLRKFKSKLIMLESFLSRATLIFLSGTIAIVSVGCTQGKQQTAIIRHQQSVVSDDLAAVNFPVEPT